MKFSSDVTAKRDNTNSLLVFADLKPGNNLKARYTVGMGSQFHDSCFFKPKATLGIFPGRQGVHKQCPLYPTS